MMSILTDLSLPDLIGWDTWNDSVLLVLLFVKFICVVGFVSLLCYHFILKLFGAVTCTFALKVELAHLGC